MPRFITTAIFIFIALFNQSAMANPALDVPAIRLQAKSFILIDALTNEVLAEEKSDQSMPPASLTKLMTLYLVAEMIANGDLTLDEKVKISNKAWKTGGSRMFIEVGKLVQVEDLIKGVAVVSGNDASIALAEHIAGSEKNFVTLMNEKAKELGMSESNFTNATGLPNKNLYSSSSDIALLARALITNFPDFYTKYYSQKKFSYNNIDQLNRNKLLWVSNLKVDGLKTGRTDEAGFNLAVSAVKDDMRLIAVIFGTSSENARSREGEKLLRWGFRYFRRYHLYDPLTTLTSNRIWMGSQDTINLGVKNAVNMIVSRTKEYQVSVRIQISEYLRAPVEVGQKVGDLVVYNGQDEYGRYPLIALETVEQGDIFSRWMDWLGMHLKRLLG